MNYNINVFGIEIPGFKNLQAIHQNKWEAVAHIDNGKKCNTIPCDKFIEIKSEAPGPYEALSKLASRVRQYLCTSVDTEYCDPNEDEE
jgi:hypothetical protein